MGCVVPQTACPTGLNTQLIILCCRSRSKERSSRRKRSRSRERRRRSRSRDKGSSKKSSRHRSKSKDRDRSDRKRSRSREKEREQRGIRSKDHRRDRTPESDARVTRDYDQEEAGFESSGDTKVRILR